MSHQVGLVDGSSRGGEVLVALLAHVVPSLGLSKNERSGPCNLLIRLARGLQVLVALLTELVQGLRLGVNDRSRSVCTLVWLSGGL